MTPPVNDPLDRCFRSVRSATGDRLPEAAPLGFAARVLASLRENEGAEAASRDWTLWLLPRAIAVAAACAMVIAAMQAVGPAAPAEWDLGNLVMNLALEGQP